jgi:hypothetical protein
MAQEAPISDQKQALRMLEQLGTFVITKKGAAIRQREKFSDAVLRTVSLYKNKVNKAETSEQFKDIIAAAKNELKSVYDEHKD